MAFNRMKKAAEAVSGGAKTVRRGISGTRLVDHKAKATPEAFHEIAKAVKDPSQKKEALSAVNELARTGKLNSSGHVQVVIDEAKSGNMEFVHEITRLLPKVENVEKRSELHSALGESLVKAALESTNVDEAKAHGNQLANVDHFNAAEEYLHDKLKYGTETEKINSANTLGQMYNKKVKILNTNRGRSEENKWLDYKDGRDFNQIVHPDVVKSLAENLKTAMDAENHEVAGQMAGVMYTMPRVNNEKFQNMKEVLLEASQHSNPQVSANALRTLSSHVDAGDLKYSEAGEHMENIIKNSKDHYEVGTAAGMLAKMTPVERNAINRTKELLSARNEEYDALKNKRRGEEVSGLTAKERAQRNMEISNEGLGHSWVKNALKKVDGKGS